MKKFIIFLQIGLLVVFISGCADAINSAVNTAVTGHNSAKSTPIITESMMRQVKKGQSKQKIIEIFGHPQSSTGTSNGSYFIDGGSGLFVVKMKNNTVADCEKNSVDQSSFSMFGMGGSKQLDQLLQSGKIQIVVKTNKTTKNDIQTLLGKPNTRSTSYCSRGKETWIYSSSKGTFVAVFKNNIVVDWEVQS